MRSFTYLLPPINRICAPPTPFLPLYSESNSCLGSNRRPQAAAASQSGCVSALATASCSSLNNYNYMATEVAASRAGGKQGESRGWQAGRQATCPCGGRRMSNNINKPPYLAAARRQCKTTRRMRNMLVVIILQPSKRSF